MVIATSTEILLGDYIVAAHKVQFRTGGKVRYGIMCFPEGSEKCYFSGLVWSKRYELEPPTCLEQACASHLYMSKAGFKFCPAGLNDDDDGGGGAGPARLNRLAAAPLTNEPGPGSLVARFHASREEFIFVQCQMEVLARLPLTWDSWVATVRSVIGWHADLTPLRDLPVVQYGGGRGEPERAEGHRGQAPVARMH